MLVIAMSEMVALATVLVLLSSLQVTNMSRNWTNMANVWASLGWNRVTLLAPDVSVKDLKQLYEACAKLHILVTAIDVDHIDRLVLDHVAVVEDAAGSFPALASVVSQRREPFRVMLIVFREVVHDWEAMGPGPVGVLVYNASAARLFACHRLSSGRSVSTIEWHLASQSNLFVEDFTLGNLTLTSVSLTWMPFIKLSYCGDNGGACQLEGINSDVTSTVGSMLDFGYEVRKEPTGNWGSVPENGLSWADPNATFHGVMGAVIDKEVDFSIAPWKISADRAWRMEFTLSFLPNRLIMITNARQKPLDYTMFFRPFRSQSWLACLIVAAVLLVAGVLIPGIFVADFGESWISKRIIVISSWSFFILLNSYFGGAMTMFLSSPPNIPFTTIEQGLREYPTWKLVILSGLEINIQLEVEKGNSAFDEYWNIIRTAEGKAAHVVPDIRAAMERLKEPGVFVLSPEALLLEPIVVEGVEIQVLGVADKGANAMIFPKHSPLVKTFNNGILRMMSSGVMSAIGGKWQRKLPRSGLLTKSEVDIRQLVTIFFVFGLAVASSVLVLAFEKFYSYSKKCCSPAEKIVS